MDPTVGEGPGSASRDEKAALTLYEAKGIAKDIERDHLRRVQKLCHDLGDCFEEDRERKARHPQPERNSDVQPALLTQQTVAAMLQSNNLPESSGYLYDTASTCPSSQHHTATPLPDHYLTTVRTETLNREKKIASMREEGNISEAAIRKAVQWLYPNVQDWTVVAAMMETTEMSELIATYQQWPENHQQDESNVDVFGEAVQWAYSDSARTEAAGATLSHPDRIALVGAWKEALVSALHWVYPEHDFWEYPIPAMNSEEKLQLVRDWDAQQSHAGNYGIWPLRVEEMPPIRQPDLVPPKRTLSLGRIQAWVRGYHARKRVFTLHAIRDGKNKSKPPGQALHASLGQALQEQLTEREEQIGHLEASLRAKDKAFKTLLIENEAVQEKLVNREKVASDSYSDSLKLHQQLSISKKAANDSQSELASLKKAANDSHREAASLQQQLRNSKKAVNDSQSEIAGLKKTLEDIVLENRKAKEHGDASRGYQTDMELNTMKAATMEAARSLIVMATDDDSSSGSMELQDEEEREYIRQFEARQEAIVAQVREEDFADEAVAEDHTNMHEAEQSQPSEGHSPPQLQWKAEFNVTIKHAIQWLYPDVGDNWSDVADAIGHDEMAELVHSWKVHPREQDEVGAPTASSVETNDASAFETSATAYLELNGDRVRHAIFWLYPDIQDWTSVAQVMDGDEMDALVHSWEENSIEEEEAMFQAQAAGLAPLTPDRTTSRQVSPVPSLSPSGSEVPDIVLSHGLWTVDDGGHDANNELSAHASTELPMSGKWATTRDNLGHPVPPQRQEAVGTEQHPRSIWSHARSNLPPPITQPIQQAPAAAPAPDGAWAKGRVKVGHTPSVARATPVPPQQQPHGAWGKTRGQVGHTAPQQTPQQVGAPESPHHRGLLAKAAKAHRHHSAAAFPKKEATVERWDDGPPI